MARLAVVAALLIPLMGVAPIALEATGVTPSTSASAHDKAADVTCTAATVSLKNYDRDATAKVTLDNVVKFEGKIPGSGYTLNETLDGTVNHTLIVTVRSNDGSQYNMDFSKTTTGCAPVVAPPTQTVTCDVISGNYNRPLTNGDHINATITPPGSQVNMYVDQNVPGGASYNGQNNLGLRWKILGVDQTPIPLTLDQIKAGIITLPYGAKLTQPSWTVSFVQTNETDTWPEFKCNRTITVDTVAAASATDACGTADDTLTVPEDTDQVSYTVNDARINGVGSVTVTASAKAGYVLKEGVVSSWTFVFADEPCVVEITVVPAATAVDMCGVTNDTLTVPKDTDQVSYAVVDTRVDGVGSVTVTASAKAGYVLKEGIVSSWTFTYTNEPCTVEITIVPAATAVDMCGVANDTLTVPKDTDQVSYKVDDTRVNGVGSVTVTASAKTGYTFDENTVTTWTLKFTDVACASTTPPKVTPPSTTPPKKDVLASTGSDIATQSLAAALLLLLGGIAAVAFNARRGQRQS